MLRKPITLLLVAMALALLAAAAVWADKDWKELPDEGELMMSEEFTLGSDARLVVKVSDVHINLIQTDSREAKVEVYARARNEKKAREYFEKLKFKAVAEDNTLRVQTARSSFRVNWGWNDDWRVRVRAIITIPKGTEMRVETSDGDIRAQTLDGALRAKTSDGDIVVEEVTGSGVWIKTSDGDVRIGRIEADEIDARSSDGDIDFESAAGKTLLFSSSDGDVTIDEVQADELYMSTSDGNVSVKSLVGEKMRGRTSDGDIRVTLAGDVALDLRSSDGDIHIFAPRSLRADLHLKGDHIHLSGNIEIDGEISRRRAKGSVGGGGVEIVARTSDGSISFEQRK
jgi:DUF4097 and DUF4098 domain-containing protein YvlB